MSAATAAVSGHRQRACRCRRASSLSQTSASPRSAACCRRCQLPSSADAQRASRPAVRPRPTGANTRRLGRVLRRPDGVEQRVIAGLFGRPSASEAATADGEAIHGGTTGARSAPCAGRGTRCSSGGSTGDAQAAPGPMRPTHGRRRSSGSSSAIVVRDGRSGGQPGTVPAVPGTVRERDREGGGDRPDRAQTSRRAGKSMTSPRRSVSVMAGHLHRQEPEQGQGCRKDRRGASVLSRASSAPTRALPAGCPAARSAAARVSRVSGLAVRRPGWRRSASPAASAHLHRGPQPYGPSGACGPGSIRPHGWPVPRQERPRLAGLRP